MKNKYQERVAVRKEKALEYNYEYNNILPNNMKLLAFTLEVRKIYELKVMYKNVLIANRIYLLRIWFPNP